MAGASELWCAQVPPKVKFFFWLALHDCLWTAEWGLQHGLQQDNACALYDQQSESVSHLFCLCVYTREVWSRLLASMGSPAALPYQDSALLQWWLHERTSLPKALRRSFDSLVPLVSWCTWKERNRRTFDRRTLLAQQLLTSIQEEGDVDAWVGAGFHSLALLTALVT
jgi:hypothetical protein